VSIGTEIPGIDRRDTHFYLKLVVPVSFEPPDRRSFEHIISFKQDDHAKMAGWLLSIIETIPELQDGMTLRFSHTRIHERIFASLIAQPTPCMIAYLPMSFTSVAPPLSVNPFNSFNS
jgi:hypothetical protein